MRKLLIILTLVLLSPPPQHAQQANIFVVVSDFNNLPDADRLVSTLSSAGYTCTRVSDASVFGLYHVRVGPYATQQKADSVRADFLRAGYHLPGTAPSLAAQQSDLEAQALAHLGGTTTNGPQATGADLERQAVASMKSNEIAAEDRRRSDELRSQQEAADRAVREAQEAADAAAAPPQESTAVSVMNAINAGLGQLNDTLAQQNAGKPHKTTPA